MIATMDELTASALALPPEERLQMAQRLFASVDEPLDSAWHVEILKRIERSNSGEDQSIPVEEVMAELRMKFR